ncbi:hypothetical protein GCM10023196_035460 [Actinoallomurus vinaceus]|uniref:Uncharacterized protein n=1 Tax=Actinoallomurus vinaceus TaxID=1080074 RepID=A0ABP8U8T6_9ACTN
MTRRNAIEGAGYFTAPAVLVIGGSLATLALTGVQHGSYGGEAAQPGPQPTVTVTATQAEQTPAPSPSRTARERAVVAAEPAARPGTGGGGAAANTRRGGGTRSSTAPRPAPGPSTSPPAMQPSRCDSGHVLSVRLPLGVLPQCAVTIGGSR